MQEQKWSVWWDQLNYIVLHQIALQPTELTSPGLRFTEISQGHFTF